MNRLQDVHQRLTQEMASLRAQWVATRQVWRDGVGDRFEKEYWTHMEQSIEKYLRALQVVCDQLDEAEQRTR